MSEYWHPVPTWRTEQARVRQLVLESNELRQFLAQCFPRYVELHEQYVLDKEKYDTDLREQAEQVLATGHLWEPGCETSTSVVEVLFPTLWPTEKRTPLDSSTAELHDSVSDQLIWHIVHKATKYQNGPKEHEKKLEAIAAARVLPIYQRWRAWAESDQIYSDREGYFSRPEFAASRESGMFLQGLGAIRLVPKRLAPIDPVTCSVVEFQRFSINDQRTIMGYWLCALHDRDNTHPIILPKELRGVDSDEVEWREWLPPNRWPFKPQHMRIWIYQLSSQGSTLPSAPALTTVAIPYRPDRNDYFLLKYMSSQPKRRLQIHEICPTDGPASSKAIRTRLRRLSEMTPPLVDYPRNSKSGAALLDAGRAYVAANAV